MMPSVRVRRDRTVDRVLKLAWEIPLDIKEMQLARGLKDSAVVDLRTGQVVARFEFVAGIDEVFDLQILPGCTAPLLSGPFADRGPAPPVWTVPP